MAVSLFSNLSDAVSHCVKTPMLHIPFPKNVRTARRVVYHLTLTILGIASGLAQPEHVMEKRNRREASTEDWSGKSQIQTTLHAPVDSGQWIRIQDWNECQAVFAENDSSVWVGTPVGIVRWNTSAGTYETFDESDGLQFTNVTGLVIDKARTLWIATTEGLASYSAGVFSHYDSPMQEMQLTTICIDSTNRIVVGFGILEWWGSFSDVGVARFDGVSWETWTNETSSYPDPSYSIVAQQDTVWISGGNSLFFLTGNTFGTAPGWTFGSSYWLAEDKDGYLWVETLEKTVKRSSAGWETIIDRDLMQMYSQFERIWNDERGGFWLSSDDLYSGSLYSGPFRLDVELLNQGITCGTEHPGLCTIPDVPGQFTAHHALSDTSQFFASMGSIEYYYTIKEGGLYRFDGVAWQVFRVPASILQNDIIGLGTSPEGKIVVSTESFAQETDGENWWTLWEASTSYDYWGTQIRFAPNGLVYTNNHNPMNETFRGLDFDGHGNLWTTHPPTRYSWPTLDPTVFTNAQMGIPMSYVRDLSVDKHERIWFATWDDGATMYDQTRWHPIPRSDSTLPGWNDNVVFADSRDRVWFGSYSSITMFDGKEWETYTFPALPYLWVNKITEDNFGGVWFATESGLINYDGSSFSIFDKTNSPFSTNEISSVTADLNGNIWVGSTEGLYVYNPSGTVSLGPSSTDSPVESLSEFPLGQFARITFTPTSDAPDPVRYQLQRGRGTHKFWTIKEVRYTGTIPSTVEITDSGSIVGLNHYRIQEVSSGGKVRRSRSVEFTGGTPSVTATSFDYFLSNRHVVLSWETSNELLVERFEIWRQEPGSTLFFLMKGVSPDPSLGPSRYYETIADSLTWSPQTFGYSLRVVYEDSTREFLETLQATGQLPLEFHVSQNYPNPFNSATTIQVILPIPGIIRLRVYDIVGREIPVGIAEYFKEGYHRLEIDMSSVGSGAYVYSVDAVGRRATGKLIFLK